MPVREPGTELQGEGRRKNRGREGVSFPCLFESFRFFHRPIDLPFLKPSGDILNIRALEKRDREKMEEKRR